MDAQLLANRIALLKHEEEKVWACSMCCFLGVFDTFDVFYLFFFSNLTFSSVRFCCFCVTCFCEVAARTHGLYFSPMSTRPGKRLKSAGT